MAEDVGGTSVALLPTVDWNLPSALAYRERPRVTLDEGLLARSCRDEAAVCFTVEGATPRQTTSVAGAHGGLTLETHIDGLVTAVGEDFLLVTEGGVSRRVRYLLPSAISLEPLRGSHVNITISLQFSSTKRPTVDALISDREGQPILWALDGSLPADQPHRPAVRLAHEKSGRRLAFSHRRSVAAVAAAGTAVLETDSGPATVAGVRIGEDDVGFVVLWA